MSRRPWYKRFPGDYLMATRELTLEERGAYNDLLELMYDRGRPIPDEDRWIAGFLGVSPRRWRTLRQVLLDAKKITVRNGEWLSNDRFERDMDLAHEEHDRQVTWGRMGGKRRAMEAQARQAKMDFGEESPDKSKGEAKAPLAVDGRSNFGDNSAYPAHETDELARVFDEFSRRTGEETFPETPSEAAKINDLGQGPLKPARASHIPESRERGDTSPLSARKPPAKAAAAKSRTKAKSAVKIPKAWEAAPLSPDVEEIVKAWPAGMIARELARFKDHAAQNGRTAKDWNAAWRNWIRKADDDWRRQGSRALGKPSGWSYAGGG